jgi:hypothetical protein
MRKIAALLVAVSLLSLPWLGSAAYGQTPQAAQELSALQGTQIEVAQLIELLTQKGVITAREKALLQQGIMLPTPQKQRSAGSSFQLLPEHIIGGP